MSTSNPPPKILLTGATGYIGGSVLTQLLTSSAPALKSIQITCLVRRQEQADLLTKNYGNRVLPSLFTGLEDCERIADVASEHDIVINTAFTMDPAAAAALVLGLERRRKEKGGQEEMWLLHTSGTSNVAEQQISGIYLEPDRNRIFSDRDDDIYSYEKMRNELAPYPQRTTELGVVDEGVRAGVKTVVIMSPLIYGDGIGRVGNRRSIQIPLYVKSTVKKRRAVMVGEGHGVWDHVHIEDLARLYEIVLLRMMEGDGEGLPVGKQGIMFSGAGRHSWSELTGLVARELYLLGKIESPEVEGLSLKEVAGPVTEGNERRVELGFASNSRTRADFAEALGWVVEKGERDWVGSFGGEVKEVLVGRRGEVRI